MVVTALRDKVNMKLLDEASCPEMHEQFRKACETLGLDSAATLAIGLHGDGVPYTKKDSIELLSFNFLGEPHGDRVPFGGVSKMYLCKCGRRAKLLVQLIEMSPRVSRCDFLLHEPFANSAALRCLAKHTFDDMLEVFQWSMRALAFGMHPTVGPSGQPLPEKLASLAGTSLGIHAVLAQVRGDWPFLKTLFSFPSWQSKAICWMCYADKDEFNYKDPRLDAKWRGQVKH
jgi:hypothetical protein